MPYTKLGDLQLLTLADTATTDNDCTVMSLNNSVSFMGNIELVEYTAYSTFATLAESMRPTKEIAIPVYIEDKLTKLTISPNGEMAIAINADGILYLNGIVFSANSRYYNAEIGNNFPQGSSPLSY